MQNRREKLASQNFQIYTSEPSSHIFFFILMKENRAGPPIMYRERTRDFSLVQQKETTNIRMSHDLKDNICNSKTVHFVTHLLILEYQNYKSLSLDIFRGSLLNTLSSTIL
jgi:hypothetical protein